MKKELREINKRLEKINYIEEKLNPKVEQNIDFVKKHFTEIIYNQAIFENVSTSMNNIKKILNGEKVSKIMPEEIIKIMNIKNAWKFILNKNVILGKTDYGLLCQINKILEEGLYYTGGQIQKYVINNSNKKTSKILSEKEIKEYIEKILNKNLTDIEKAIEIFLYILKNNLFIDGNKSTALIFVNQYLISKGKGIINISEEYIKDFNELLDYYNKDKGIIKIKLFLKDKCYIQG